MRVQPTTSFEMTSSRRDDILPAVQQKSKQLDLQRVQGRPELHAGRQREMDFPRGCQRSHVGKSGGRVRWIEAKPQQRLLPRLLATSG
jgi:hypothetical protein